MLSLSGNKQNKHNKHDHTLTNDVSVAEVNWHDGNDHISLPVSPVDELQSSIFQLQEPCQQEEKSPSIHPEPPIEVKPTPKLPNVTQSTCTQGVLQPPLHDGRDDLAGVAMEDREECTTQLPTPAEKGHMSNQEHQDEDDAAHDAKTHPGVCQSRQLVQSSTGGSSLQHPTSPLGARKPIIADGGSQVEMQPFSLESAVLSLRQENWVNGTALTHTLNTFNPPHSRYHIVEAGWVDSSLTKHAIRRYRPNLSSLDAMVVPLCHSQSHWTIGIVHLRSGQLEIYDPLNSQKTLDASARALRAFAQGLGSEQSWEVQASECRLRQEDSSHCGIYVAVFALCRMTGNAFPTKLSSPHLWRRAFATAISPNPTIPQGWDLAMPDLSTTASTQSKAHVDGGDVDQLGRMSSASLGRIDHLQALARLARDIAMEARFIKTLTSSMHDMETISSALVNLESLSASIPLLPRLPGTLAFVDQLKEYHRCLQQANESQGKLCRVAAQLDSTIAEFDQLAQEFGSKRTALADDLRTLARRLQIGLDKRLGAECS